MGGLEFISAIADALAWPLAVVICVFILREPLTGLLRRVETVELPGSKATFAAGLVQLEESVAAIRATSPAEQDEEPAAEHDSVTEWAVLEERASSLPREAVLDAWSHLEFQLNVLSDLLDPARPHGWPQITNNFEAWDHWPSLRPAVVELRYLRDAAARSAVSPSHNDAKRYVLAAEDVVLALQRLSTTLPVGTRRHGLEDSHPERD
jgi:hypothetical protein